MKFALLILISLNLNTYSQNDTIYSFFVAGHVYGNPGANNIGVHPPFAQKFNYIKSNSKIEFGVFTGDIVSPFPIEQDWIEIDENVDSLGIPVYFCVGNHDMENRPLYEERYGRTYNATIQNNDLFIFLDPNIDSWNISGDQITFIDSCLNLISNNTSNIFVFSHQVLWKEKNTDFSYIGINSSAGRADTINFWSTIAPKFHNLENNVVFFAGDVGAPWATTATYDKIDNLTFITSGMGGNTKDNFLISHVMANGNINYEIICLDTVNSNCIPDLKSKARADSLPFITNSFFSVNTEPINIFPNPAKNTLHLTKALNVKIFNFKGQFLMSLKNYKIDIAKLSNGIYIIEINSGNKIERKLFEVIK